MTAARNKYSHFSKKVKPNRLPIWVDQASERKDALKKCETYLKKLAKNEESLQRYQNVDLKNYNDWHESHFSGLLGDVRIIRDRFRETRQLICEVYEESQISKCPLHEAYRRITLGIKSSPQPHSSRESSSGNFHSSSSSEQTDFDSNEQGFDEFLSEAFEEIFGSRSSWRGSKKSYDDLLFRFKRDFGQNGRFGKNIHDTMKNSKTHKIDSYEIERKSRDEALMKKLYRGLAQELHPDLHPHQSEREREFWLEIQEAYREHNFRRLLYLDALLKVYRGQLDHVEADSSVLGELILDLHRRHLKAQRETRKLKKCVEWNFTEKLQNLKKMKEIHAQIQSQILRENNMLSQELEEMKMMIAGWDRKNQKPSKTRREKKRSVEHESLYDLHG